MKIDIPYRRESISLGVPDSCDLVVLEPNEFKGGPPAAHGTLSVLPDSDATSLPGSVAHATAHPIGSAPLARFLEGGRSVLVIINDATRPTPTNLVLDEIAGLLDAAEARFIVATGAHRAPTDDEYRQILGPHHDRLRPRVSAHDARDDSSLADLGKTRNGTPILLNKAVFGADRIVVIGSVEPHYFAGYTGGRKAFLPGVAGFATVQANHKLALSPLARALELERNPVGQDMDDALNLIHVPTFSIMTVLDKDQRLAWCSAGDIRASFKDAVDKANSIYSVPIDALFDIVVSAARYPMDIDLYQSQKAIDNGSLALADGGTLIMVSSCRDGIGDKTFLDLMGSASSPDGVLEKIGSGYRLGFHKAAKIALIARRAEILAYTELDPDLVRKAFIKPCADLQEAFDAAVARMAIAHPGRKPSVCVIPDGSVTVPRLRQS